MSSAVRITAPDGAGAVVQLLGAQVTSWTPAGGEEQLFMASHARPGERTAKGGIPVMFPQFGNLGPLPNHGFARDLPWKHSGGDVVDGMRRERFSLVADTGWSGRWPHPFALELVVAVGGPRLAVTLTVRNIGTRTWFFTGGLHTYLRVGDIGDVTLEGLGGRPYRDRTQNGAELVQAGGPLRVSGETDRIFVAAPGPVVLREGARAVTVTAAGLPDVVVWNPWETETRFPEFASGDYRHMLCVEAALIAMPHTMEPGRTWSGTQTLVVS